MSDRFDQPVDVATIAADDALLDAVGRGEHRADDDQVTAMLLAWRAEIGEGDDDLDSNADLIRAATAGDATRKTASARPWLLSRRLWNVAAGVVVAAGLAAGMGVASNHAEPGTALWPVTKVLHPQRAEVLAAEHAIERARAAAAAGEYDEARRLLDEAQRHLARVDDKAAADRLRAEVEAVLRGLPVAAPAPAPTPAPADSAKPAPAAPAPATPGAGPAATGQPDPPGDPTGPAPDVAGPEPEILPEISPLPPAPSLSPSPQLPLPPLPSPLLPGLPLPTGGLLGAAPVPGG